MNSCIVNAANNGFGLHSVMLRFKNTAFTLIEPADSITFELKFGAGSIRGRVLGIPYIENFEVLKFIISQIVSGNFQMVSKVKLENKPINEMEYGKRIGRVAFAKYGFR